MINIAKKIKGRRVMIDLLFRSEFCLFVRSKTIYREETASGISVAIRKI
jgi:hypothetical protein